MTPYFLKKLICGAFKHKYKSIRQGRLLIEWELLKCTRCQKAFLLNHSDHQILEADHHLLKLLDGDY